MNLIKSLTVLLLTVWTIQGLSGEPLTREEIDVLIPSGTYSASQVREMVWAVYLAGDAALAATVDDAVAEAVRPLLAEIQAMEERQWADWWAGAAVGAGVGAGALVLALCIFNAF
jgi:hypothetical protein